jgi:hypothetical protein
MSSPWICPQNQALYNHLTALTIMSELHSPARASAPFAPRAFVPVTVGRTRTAINLYPVINQGMPHLTNEHMHPTST